MIEIVERVYTKSYSAHEIIFEEKQIDGPKN